MSFSDKHMYLISWRYNLISYEKQTPGKGNSYIFKRDNHMIQLIYEVDFCVLTISFIFLLTSPKGNREYGGE